MAGCARCVPQTRRCPRSPLRSCGPCWPSASRSRWLRGSAPRRRAQAPCQAVAVAASAAVAAAAAAVVTAAAAAVEGRPRDPGASRAGRGAPSGFDAGTGKLRCAGAPVPRLATDSMPRVRLSSQEFCVPWQAGICAPGAGGVASTTPAWSAAVNESTQPSAHTASPATPCSATASTIKMLLQQTCSVNRLSCHHAAHDARCPQCTHLPVPAMTILESEGSSARDDAKGPRLTRKREISTVPIYFAPHVFPFLCL
jgi:hypothetical protein